MAKSLREVEEEVARITDNLDEPVDMQIRPVVIALRYRSYPTFGSCAGHFDHGLAFPWVDVGIIFEDTKMDKKENKTNYRRMKKLLEQFYAHRKTDYRLHMAFWGSTKCFRVQSFSSSIDYEGGAKNEAELRSLRDEMDAFAEFLLNLNHA